MSKCGISLFLCSVHSTGNLRAWMPKGTFVTLMSFLSLITETVTRERIFFFQNYLANVVKIEENREELSTPLLWSNHQN